eukprot:scaffold6248_cov87-Cylindrotheca_fusiformis.AAC.5
MSTTHTESQSRKPENALALCTIGIDVLTGKSYAPGTLMAQKIKFSHHYDDNNNNNDDKRRPFISNCCWSHSATTSHHLSDVHQ